MIITVAIIILIPMRIMYQFCNNNVNSNNNDKNNNISETNTILINPQT